MHNLMPILFMDDDCCDAIIFKRTLKNLGIKNPLIHLFDGKEALEYLRNAGNKRPWLIISDLHAPEMNGFEFIKALKEDDILKRIPVVIFSGSCNETDVSRCFDLGAAGYVEKPESYKKLVEVIQTIYNYWSLNQLPNGHLKTKLNSPVRI